MKLPKELQHQVAALLHQRYGDELGPGETFSADGELSADQAEVRLLLEAPGGIERVEVVVQVTAKEAGGDAEAALYQALDVGDATFGEWLEGGRAERWPIDFVDVTWQGRRARVRLLRSRPAVEAQADRMLEGEEPFDGEPDA